MWASIARTGIQHYTDADGSLRREFRPESGSVPESLASFAGKAITMEHPPVLLDSENTKNTLSDLLVRKLFMTTDLSVQS